MLKTKMYPISRSHRSLFLMTVLIAGLLFSGCRGPQQPDPSMTAVRSGAGSGTGADWISPDDIARAEALGLGMRDADMLDAEAGELVGSVYFDFDQSFIRPEDRGTLQEVANYLQANPQSQLLAEGHCDWRGTTEYNMALGDRRATSVTSYLANLGIAPDRLATVSKGDLEAVTEGSDEQMRMDRRADLLVIE